MPITDNKNPVNYEALTKMKRSFLLWWVVALLGLAIAVVPFIIESLTVHEPQMSQTDSWIVGASFLVGFLMITLSPLMYKYRKNQYQTKVINEFVVDNNWQIAGFGESEVATTLLGKGYDTQFKCGFTGVYHGKSFNALIYEFTVDRGKSSQDFSFANIHFKLDQQFPLMLLDNRSNDYFTLISDLPSKIPGGKELVPEGNFSKHFKLTIMPGSERTVLEALTPDFMEELLDLNNGTDVEIEANDLYVIKHLNFGGLGSSDMSSLFDTAEIVLKNISELAFSWQASSSPETVAQMAAQSLVPRTELLNRGHRISIVAMVIAAVFFIVGTIFGILMHL